MNATAMILAISISALCGYIILLPTLTARRRELADIDYPAGSSAYGLQDQLNRSITTIRDLDFDFDTGKITEDDYVEQRKLLIGRGVSALIKLDASRQKEIDKDHELEEMIAAYREGS